MASMYPQKRKRSADANALAVYRPYKAVSKTRMASPYRKRNFVPGRDRIGGFYGRFHGEDAELKFLDVNSTATFAMVGAIQNSLCQIAQGVGENQRVGRKCTVKSIDWRWEIALAAQDAVAVANTGDAIRVIIFVDKQANGAGAGVTDILETASWQSFYNLANQMRFVILLDELVSLNQNTLASDGAGVVSTTGMVRDYKWHHECDIPLEFSSTTGTLSEIRSNNIGLLKISALGVAQLNSKFRLRFADN